MFNYLPKKRRYVEPIKQVLLDGLYWRGRESFSRETDYLVGFLLRDVHDNVTQDETLEVLVTLATRAGHPYNVDRLKNYLAGQAMAVRDEGWTGFLRRCEEHSIVRRFIAWVERTAGAQLDGQEATNELRLLGLVLTTTNRLLRDQATRALVLRGSRHPEQLFDETLASLSLMTRTFRSGCWPPAMGLRCNCGRLVMARRLETHCLASPGP